MIPQSAKQQRSSESHLLEALIAKGNLSQRGLAEAVCRSAGNVNRIVKELAEYFIGMKLIVKGYLFI